MAKKSPGNTIAFASIGPKITAAKLEKYGLKLPAELQSFLLENNGGEPKDAYFQMIDDYGMEDVIPVEEFYGATAGLTKDISLLRLDIHQATEEWSNILPKGSLPIGRASEESFLVYFYEGKLKGTVCYVHWDHDGFDEDEFDPKPIVLAKSLKQFLGLLRHFGDFIAAHAFPIVDARLKPAELIKILKRLGCTRDSGKTTPIDRWSWDQFEERTLVPSQIYIRENGATDQPRWDKDTKLPKLRGVPDKTKVMHFRFSKFVEEEALETIRETFDGILQMDD